MLRLFPAGIPERADVNGAGLCGFIFLPYIVMTGAAAPGANRFQRVLHIDIPTILPTASIMLILAVGNIMNEGIRSTC